ncbi:MAG: YitT family protein, partial [Oscillospiraceae bacterium]|nr:YitT family protein [Oscillospiraceae bacterium]
MKRKIIAVLKYLALDFVGIILFSIGWRCFIFPNKAGFGGFAGIASLIGYILNRDDLGSFLFLI